MGRLKKHPACGIGPGLVFSSWMDKHIGDRLIELRHTLGLTQKTFGEKIHLSKGYITSLEKARQPLNERLICLITETFGVSPGWLKTGIGEMFTNPQNTRLAEITGIFNQLNPDFQNFVIRQLKQLLEMNHNHVAPPPSSPPVETHEELDSVCL